MSFLEGDRINVVKWGEEYRQYMKEVPRLNFILGTWRRIERNRKQKQQPTSSQSKPTIPKSKPS